MSTMVHFLYFLLFPKTSYSLASFFKCIWKILFCSFRKRYGLLRSVLPLERCLTLLTHFLILLSSVSHEQYLQSLLIIQCCERTLNDLSESLKYLAKLRLIFRSNKQKIQKISHFSYFNDRNSRSKHDNLTNDPIFLICSLSSVLVYFTSAFQNLQIQFQGVPPIPYVLVCKIQTYMPKMTLSNPSVYTSFFYTKFPSFWCDIFCSQIWYQFGHNPMD